MEKRNIGIDILRILSMLYIVMIHFFNHGGILSSTRVGTIEWGSSLFLWTIVDCGVNIFATISGFVLFEQDHKEKRWSPFWELWCRAFFYGVLFLIIGYCISPERVTTEMIFKAVFPLYTREYWYLSSYFFVFLLYPIINEQLKSSSYHKDKIIIISSFILLYFSHAFEGFYSIVLLLFSYVIGAYIKKYSFHEKIRLGRGIVILVGLHLFNWAWCLISTPLFGRNIGDLGFRSDFPTVICISVLYVVLFSKISIKQSTSINRIMSFTLPSIFSVYLINDNPVVRQFVINNSFSNLSDSVLKTVVFPLSFAIAFFVVSVFMDHIRILVFKVLKVKMLINIILNTYIRVSIRIVDTVNRLVK